MVAKVELISPREIRPNKDNPRLIFRSDELDALEQSIKHQGILVPLTIFRDGAKYTLLDGERRWRCAIKIGLGKVPAIIQQKPNRVTNIMMMFAIHNARKDWDPLPTALKLQELEGELTKGLGKKPSESEIAAAASISRGEVRRYKKILNVPGDLRDELLAELEKPRHDQKLTVDHVIETRSGVAQLQKRGIIETETADRLTTAIIEKFRSGVITNTTEPRKLARIARSAERGEITTKAVSTGLSQVIKQKNYSINNLFRDTVEQYDFEHGTEQLVRRVVARLEELGTRQSIQSNELKTALSELAKVIREIL